MALVAKLLHWYVICKANSWLNCGKAYEDHDELPVENCNLKCTDGTKVCGGEDAYSIYLSM